jgi:protein-disulfide isomerase
MLTNEVKILSGIGFLTLIIVVGAALLLGSSGKNSNHSNEPRVEEAILVRKDSVKIGSASAKVTLVEFGDYQCPACASAHPIVNRIIENNKKKILFVFRHFPLPLHKNARLAAIVAEAAGRQGKYWEMHDRLYENQTEWAESNKPIEFFNKYAAGLKLDMDQFAQDLKDKKIAKKIDSDKRDGLAAAVQATPTFFVNGRRIQGVMSYDELQKLIDAEEKGN